MGYACGTCRMGNDPSRSVVNLEGRSHEVINLTIADADADADADASILPG